MKKYTVSLRVSAFFVVHVTAENAEQAAEKAYSNAGIPSLCHECAHELELNDVISDVHAINEETGEEHTINFE